MGARFLVCRVRARPLVFPAPIIMITIIIIIINIIIITIITIIILITTTIIAIIIIIIIIISATISATISFSDSRQHAQDRVCLFDCRDGRPTVVVVWLGRATRQTLGVAQVDPVSRQADQSLDSQNALSVAGARSPRRRRQ